jgi:formate hydrogenlyase transcriptional activator
MLPGDQASRGGNPGHITVEQRQVLVLRAWEAATTERELRGVLAAVADVLTPIVPFTSIGIVSFGGEKAGLLAAHVVGIPAQEGETLWDYVLRSRSAFPAPQSLPERRRRPDDFGHAELERAAREAGVLSNCRDLLEKDEWYDYEFMLASAGIRAYVSLPLVAQSKLIGTAVFSRGQPEEFTPEQVAILSSVSRALAVAAGNALANEEIRKLRDQLEAENIALRAQLGQAPWFEGIVGDSLSLRRVLEAVEQVASTDATVLITGETGTGKELIARAIHRRSPRAHGPLVQVNCSAIPDTLLSSELFGHERGAFTGAVERRKGRFEQAHGGSLFLDEVADLPQEAQVMLLRVLQEREFERLGGSQTLRVDVRLVAATNRDLGEEVRAERFRSDLYYRLNVFPIHIAPLRQRPEDIPLLVEHFAAKYGARFGRTIARIDRRAMNLLGSYHWPGNVRELENVVERAVILSRGGTLRVERDMLQPGPSLTADMEENLQMQEREMIESALRASRGRVAGPNGAAKRLGLAPSTLEFRIKRLGIDKFRYRGPTRS